MGATRPGSQCTTHGDYVSDGTKNSSLTPAPGSVCGETSSSPIPDSLRTALSLFQTEAVNFAVRFIPDHAVRQEYIRKTREMANAILDDVRKGTVTAEEGQRLANQLRNEIMETARGASSDVGRAWAQSLKAQGRTLAELQERYAAQLFKRGFETLGEAERNQVFLAIIDASGRSRPSVVIVSARLARLSRGLLFVTAAIAVFEVAIADDPQKEAIRQGTVVGAGLAGGALAGAAATGLLCGPGAPVCVGLIVFVGGGLAAFGAEKAFDRWFK